MSSSFIDVRQAGVAVAPPTSAWKRFLKRTTAPEVILQNINFQLNQGDWVTVYGGAGAGKTTLLRLLTGVLEPTQGRVLVNGRPASESRLAAGYVSDEESEPSGDTVMEILTAFGRTHRVENLPGRLGHISEVLQLRALAHRPANGLSTTERLRLNLARAALSDAPLILLDDVAEHMGADQLKRYLFRLFEGRTVVVATRSPAVAQALNLPIILLHQGKLACSGTCDEMATRVAAPRVLNAWIEGIRYDIFRDIKRHPGVAEVLLLPDGRFQGQRLRITVKSGHHLPALYDLVSRVPVIRLEEVPVQLEDILKRL